MAPKSAADQASTCEVRELRREMRDLKEVVADLTILPNGTATCYRSER